MKKGWKIFWIICAVLAAVGIFLAIAGTALGGLVLLRDNRDEEIVRSWLDRIGIRHEVRVTTEVQAVPDVPGSLEDDGYVPGEPDGKNVTAYEGIDELDLELTGMGIRMIPYEAESGTTRDGESIIVDISGCREDLRDLIKVSHSGTTLKVEMEDRGWAGTQDSGILYISVPRGKYFEKISADAKAGLIELSEIQAEELSVKADAGEIIASGFSVNTLEADCGVGQITLEGEVTDSAEISCNVGSVVCTLPGTMDAYNYEVKCAVGELLIDGESYSGMSNKMEIDNGSSCQVEAECDLGSVEIIFE